jgi:Ca2+-binding RTX toxin-like protein
MPIFAGTSKNDNLIGSIYNDTLDGSQGNDTLTGGEGADFFKVTAGTDTITDLGRGSDILTVNFGAAVSATLTKSWIATVSTKNSGTVYINTYGIEVNLSSASGGGGQYTIKNTSSNGTSLTGSSDSDSLIGGVGNDFLSGGSGNDTLTSTAGKDTLTGGEGADYFNVGVGSSVIQDLGNGADIINVNTGATVTATIYGAWVATAFTKNLGTVNINTNGMAVDLSKSMGGGKFSISNLSSTGTSLIGQTGVDSISGGAGNDYIFGMDGNDILLGGNGNDTIIGGGGDDNINGGLGNDKITIGGGKDIVTGGDGVDKFYIDSSIGYVIPTITDFTVGIDKIGIAKSFIKNLNLTKIGIDKATSPDMNLLYNPTTGILKYDMDGSGKLPALDLVLIGVSSHPKLSLSDFDFSNYLV